MTQIIVKPELKTPRLTLASDGRVTLKVRNAQEAYEFTPLVKAAVEKYGVPPRTLRGRLERLSSKLLEGHLSTVQGASREYTTIRIET
jgi:hypothetical protein